MLLTRRMKKHLLFSRKKRLTTKHNHHNIKSHHRYPLYYYSTASTSSPSTPSQVFNEELARKQTPQNSPYSMYFYYNDKPFDMRSSLKNRKEYFALDREYYVTNEVFFYDLEHIWKRSWLFVGYECQLKNPGDYLTFQMGNESIIVVKDQKGNINGFHNVCRHRGYRIVTKECGNSNNFVCPYHQWTYSNDGKLKKATHMDDNFNASDYSLQNINLRTVAGLIFISFSKNPPSFEDAYDRIYKQTIPHQLNNAKVAFVKDYEIKSNWKLVYENNRECYHCPGGHPEYIKSNYDTTFSYEKINGQIVRVTDSNHPRNKEVNEWIDQCTEKWKSYGFECTTDSSFPGEGWYRATRTPLRKGWVNETIDGKPVAPLMGVFKDRDMGVLRIHTLPNFWLHGSSDYVCSTRLTPISPHLTRAQVIWLVHKDAEEGKDYDLDKILPLWQKTSEQDWELCENNHLGVLSSSYIPGPLSFKKESGVEKFIAWYIANIKKGFGISD